jgi:hypothetical protein
VGGLPFGVTWSAPSPVRREVVCGGAVALNRHDHASGRLGARLPYVGMTGAARGAGSLGHGRRYERGGREVSSAFV